MSLKSFHVLLITLSSVLALVFGGWSIRAFVVTGATGHVVAAVLSFAAAAGLVIYILWFARKIRSREEEERRRRKLIRPLVVPAAAWVLSTRAAGACSVCYGEAEGPMIDAARLGVYLLFGLVFAVQLCFVLFFLHLRKRARDHREEHAEPALAER